MLAGGKRYGTGLGKFQIAARIMCRYVHTGTDTGLGKCQHWNGQWPQAFSLPLCDSVPVLCLVRRGASFPAAKCNAHSPCYYHRSSPLTPFSGSAGGSAKPRFLNSSRAIRFLCLGKYVSPSDCLTASVSRLVLSLPVHPAHKILLGQVAAFVLVDAADLFHAGKIADHGLFALAWSS